MKKTAFIYFLGIGIVVGCNSPEPQTTSAEKGTTQEESTIEVLPSWNEGETKQAIVDFVEKATTEGSTDFIPVKDRIAVFDNDGTLWPEQPYPNQLQYTIDYIIAHWDENPEWKKDPVLKGVKEGNIEPLKKSGMKGLVDMINSTHTNISEADFSNSVATWADTAKDARFGKGYTELVYQPMLELLDMLRQHDFKTFIVSGGGADFMRVWSEEVYGIPPYQIIGSYGEVKYEVVDGKPTLTKVEGNIYVDDKMGKPQAIHRFIGKVPVFCGGNSDGDQAMMQYTSGSDYNSLCLIVRHTDAEREYQYETKTLSGHLETALTEAEEKDWLVVDVKTDWKKVFPFE